MLGVELLTECCFSAEEGVQDITWHPWWNQVKHMPRIPLVILAPPYVQLETGGSVRQVTGGPLWGFLLLACYMSVMPPRCPEIAIVFFQKNNRK